MSSSCEDPDFFCVCIPAIFVKLFLILLVGFLVGCILPKYWQLFCDWLCSLQQREEQESSEEFYSS